MAMKLLAAAALFSLGTRPFRRQRRLIARKYRRMRLCHPTQPLRAACSLVCALTGRHAPPPSPTGAAQEMKPEHTMTLTPDNFNDWIKTEVDAGKTAFVRWIASEGWCVAQTPLL